MLELQVAAARAMQEWRRGYVAALRRAGQEPLAGQLERVAWDSFLAAAEELKERDDVADDELLEQALLMAARGRQE
jgi:hypothetical protein